MTDFRECPSCALEFEDEGQDACPYCGYEFPGSQPRSVQWVAWLLVLLLLWPAIKGLMWLLS